MRMGFVSAILENDTLEEVIDYASENYFSSVEVACWPIGKAKRRYSGVTHINVDELDDNKIQYIKNYCKQKGVTISSLAYYPNTMDVDLDKRQEAINHINKLIIASSKLDINMVTTFIGRDQFRTIEENIELFRIIWPPIIKLAEEYQVKIAIENCPMLFGTEQWPGGQNLAATPNIWRKLFAIIDSEYFGLNYDPSHFVWQMMDYIQPIYEFKNKIFHVHFKDIKIYVNKLNQHGIMAYPLEYMSPKLPGLGDVDWSKYVSALSDIGYSGDACIEIEDKSFEDSDLNIRKALQLSKKYLEQFVI